MAEMHKCAECGYLAVRHPETLALVGPDEEQRRTGHPTGSYGIPMAGRVPTRDQESGHVILGIDPCCAVGEPYLVGKVPDGGMNNLHCEAARTAMQHEWECPQFTKWIPGLTPKEHIHMNLLEMQRTREDRRDSEQRTREDRRDRKQNIALVIAGFALALGPTSAWLLNRYIPPPTAQQQSPPQPSAPGPAAAKQAPRPSP